MNADERQTWMWQAIVGRAFTLDSDKQRANWLRCFTQSVLNSLDDPVVTSPKQSIAGFKGRFGNRCLLTCDYTIAQDRSQFDLLRPQWYAQYGTDSTVFACAPGGREVVDEVTAEDLVCVLRGMVEHPRTHLHVYEDSGRHEVRIGTGLAEPFLFLFQLRFQLCLDSTRRQAEFSRLQGIFTPNWFRGRDQVKPSHLFGLQ